ncbi:MAG: hypothetical protein KGD63_05600 [Candidatus Lokiarchaeota archaeon]|nr:hypothetical protein [Candidatus Lokiarchaeota archaeon]
MLSHIFQGEFQFFGFYDSLELGLYMVIIGYYFLIFAYFLIMRFRISKKAYWIFFSTLFVALASSRLFFIIMDFYIPELEGTITNNEIVNLLMINYRLATFSTWMGTTCLMGVLGILLFPPDAEIEKKKPKLNDNVFKNFLNIHKKKVKYGFRIGLLVIPILLGILVFFLPDSTLIDPDIIDKYSPSITPIYITIGGWQYPVWRFIFNFVFQPLLVAIVPFIFIYLALKTFGVLRRSYAINGIGFLIYYVGRIAKGAFEVIGWTHAGSIVPPLLILLSLLLIVIANSFEALK